MSLTFGAPAADFLYNGASNQCLNVDGCSTPIIFDGCRTTGGTCAGPNSYANEQWTLSAAGALTTHLPGGACATAAADLTVSLAACASPLSARQTWSYAPSSGTLQTADNLCLTAAEPPPPPASNTTRLLLARPLHDGSVALLALNNLAQAANLTCGLACFQAMGFASTDVLTVRDLWLHEDVAVVHAVTYDVLVAANGSSRLLKLTRR